MRQIKLRLSTKVKRKISAHDKITKLPSITRLPSPRMITEEFMSFDLNKKKSKKIVFELV